jgi:capsule polysaccharide export protein KpsE/RkpR
MEGFAKMYEERLEKVNAELRDYIQKYNTVKLEHQSTKNDKAKV